MAFRGARQSWAAFKDALPIMDGLSEVLKLHEETSKAREDSAAIRVELEGLFRDLASHLASSTSPGISSSMENICRTIQIEIDRINPRHRGNTKDGDDSAELLACYQRIQRCVQRLALDANLSTWEIVEQQTADARLDRLAPVFALCYNSAEAMILKRHKSAKDRKEILLQMRSWVYTSAAGSVYWLSGNAGTGKTTIAYTLCEELDSTARLGASVFCSRLLPECRNVNRIIPSMAYQLAQWSRPFRSALTKVLASDRDIHTRLLWFQLDRLIIKPLHEARDALPEDMVVVIDALDECNDEESKIEILDLLLTRFQDLPIRFIVCSRPEPCIKDKLVGASAQLVLQDTMQADMNTTPSKQESTTREFETRNVHDFDGQAEIRTLNSLQPDLDYTQDPVLRDTVQADMSTIPPEQESITRESEIRNAQDFHGQTEIQTLQPDLDHAQDSRESRPYPSNFQITASTLLDDAVSYITQSASVEDLTSHLTPNSGVPIARSALSDIYLATLADGTQVAVKCLRRLDNKHIKRAARELLAWSCLKHENILEFKGLAKRDGCIAMVSPWMEAGSVVSVLKKHRDIDRVGLMKQLVGAVAYIHKMGVVHGDIKGDNVLLSRDHTIKLTDFGMSIMQAPPLQFSETDLGGGTMRWMAPELFRDGGNRSKEADIYALGMTLYEIITMEVPFAELSSNPSIILAVAQKRQTPTRPKTLEDGSLTSVLLWSVMYRCWAFEPEQRASASEVGVLLGPCTEWRC